ncbi:MAG: c-type cytochrome biogenesis protein CcmI [Pseudomonadota bacterium]
MGIWLFILILAFLAVALGFSGLWRAGNNPRLGNEELDRELYRAREAEIDHDFELGRIDADAREAAKVEIARKLLRQSDAVAENQSMPASRTLALVFASMIFVPVFSLVLYNQIGTPEIPVTSTAVQTENTEPTLQELVETAENQLKSNPDDILGWRVIAPVYERFGQFTKAANAYRNMLRIEGNSIETEFKLARVLVLGNENRVPDEALEIFQSHVEQDPDNLLASYFVALAKFQRGEADQARAIWQSILQKAAGDEPWLPLVQVRLNELSAGTSALKGISQTQREQIEGMVAGLAARLDEDPDDQEGWEQLVRSYMVLEKQEEAKLAYEKAKNRFSEDEQFVARLKNMVENKSGVDPSQ